MNREQRVQQAVLNRIPSSRILVTAQRSVSLDDHCSTFLCPICFENVDILERWVPKSCPEEVDHGCCARCSTIFIKGRISEGRLAELFCPMGVAAGGCGGDKVASATTSEVERLLRNEEAALKQFRLLSMKKANANLSECPQCKTLCAPIVEKLPQITCNSCGSSFCAHHAWAHRAESEKGGKSEAEICAEFERKLVAEARLASTNFGYKDCPM